MLIKAPLHGLAVQRNDRICILLFHGESCMLLICGSTESAFYKFLCIQQYTETHEASHCPSRLSQRL